MGPHTGAFRDALGGNTEVLAGENEHIFKNANEVDGAKMRATFSRKITAQVEDWVADELAWPVICDITTTIYLVNFDTFLRKE